MGRSFRFSKLRKCEGESTQSCEARFSPSRSPFPGTHFPQLFQSITYSRQTTRKLSLSTQLSSEALIAHPTPGAPLNLTLIQPPKQPPSPTALIQPPKQPHSPTALIQPSEQLPSPTALILSPEQPHSPTALKSQPVRRVLPVDGLCRRGADS